MIGRNVKFCAYCGTQVGSRVVKEEEYPSVEVMEQQILASKEEATDTVESRRLRYKQRGSFVVKLGNIAISNWKKLIELVKSKTEQVELVKEEKEVERVEEKKVVSSKKKKKNKKKRKGRK